MTGNALPQLLDPYKYAVQQASLMAVMPVSRFTRFAEVLADKSGEVTVCLEFSMDEQRRIVVKGTLSAEVVMTCQRCLECVTVKLESEVALMGAVDERQASSLPSGYDPLMITGDELAMLPVVEEELILSLPFVASHEEGLCTVVRHDTGWGGDDIPVTSADGSDCVNPFQILASIKH